MIDTTIQLNGHNSYKVTELLLAYPFGVQGMSYITHSFQAYCTSSLSSANRAKTKFFDGTGATLSEVSHAFAVPAVFGKIEITVPVPATAFQAQLVFLHGGTDWWFAEPKSEEGQTATPYNVNYAGPLTYITPNGIYTGMMTTGQIVVTGSVNSPDETLDTRLVTINNNQINLTATSNNHGTRITSIEAGQASFVTHTELGEPNGTYINGGNIKTGKVQSVDGQSYFDLVAGELKAVDVDLTGKIVGTSGSIGAWNISSNKLISTNGRLSLDPVSEQIVLGDVTLKDVSVGGSYGKVRMSSTQTSDDIVFMVTNNTSSPTGFDARIWVETPIKNQYAYLDSRSGLSINDGNNWWGITRYGLSDSFVLKVDMIRIGGNIYTLTRDANGFLKAI